MKNRIYLKSTLRQPLRSILLLLLIGLLSAAFTVRVVEYVLIQRETGRLGDYYRAIGTLQSANSEANKTRYDWQIHIHIDQSDSV